MRAHTHGGLFSYIVAALVGCVISLTPTAASTCSCAAAGSSCEAAWQADAVFIGRVVSIEASTSGRRSVQLSVTETFRGPHLPQVTLVTGSGGPDCGYPFRTGESYVVYAYRSPTGQLSTSSCSRTQPVTTAADDLGYLRSLGSIKPDDLARVRGRVELWDWARREQRRIPRVTITARRS